MSNQQPSAKNQGVGRDQLRQRGEEVVAQLGHGTNRPRRQYLATIPGAQEYTREAVFASVWSRPGLTLRLRLLVTISVAHHPATSSTVTDVPEQRPERARRCRRAA